MKAPVDSLARVGKVAGFQAVAGVSVDGPAASRNAAEDTRLEVGLTVAAPGVEKIVGMIRLARAASDEGAGPALTLTPSRHGTDGFFIAALERRA